MTDEFSQEITCQIKKNTLVLFASCRTTVYILKNVFVWKNKCSYSQVEGLKLCNPILQLRKIANK